jgi:hypothetical protein
LAKTAGGRRRAPLPDLARAARSALRQPRLDRERRHRAGQRTQTFYKPPGPGDAGEYVEGFYYALLETALPFDFVHEDDLSPETLRKYAALILPNVAFLSDAQCRQLEAFVAIRRVAAGDVRNGAVRRARPSARRFRPRQPVRHQKAGARRALEAS